MKKLTIVTLPSALPCWVVRVNEMWDEDRIINNCRTLAIATERGTDPNPLGGEQRYYLVVFPDGATDWVAAWEIVKVGVDEQVAFLNQDKAQQIFSAWSAAMDER